MQLILFILNAKLTIEANTLTVSDLTTVTPNYENVTSFTISTQLEMKECGAYGVVNNRRL